MKQIKVIFLDIDGVLNNDTSYNEANETSIFELKRLIRQTGAHIVISSDWKKDIVDVKQYFDYNGLPAYLDYTPNLTNLNNREERRATEIRLWLEIYQNLKYEIDYVILDDMDLNPHGLENFIHVNSEYGLTNLDVNKAVKLLKKELMESS